MHFSHIPSAEPSTQQRSVLYSPIYERSTSSAERSIRMMVRISMFLLTLDDATTLETIANSMLRGSIQTSNLVSEAYEQVGTMQRKMAIFVAGNFNDHQLQDAMKHSDKMMAGTISEMQILKKSFGVLRENISSKIWSNHSTASMHTQSGTIEWIDHLTFTLQNCISTYQNMVHFGNGSGDIWMVIKQVSDISHPTRSCERRPCGPFPWRSASPCSSGLACGANRKQEPEAGA